MLKWQKCKIGLTTPPRGGIGEELGFATGIFTVFPIAKKWRLCLLHGKIDGGDKLFGFAWDFGSRERCQQYAEAIVVAYGLHQQVYGDPEPSDEDLRLAQGWRNLRRRMVYVTE